MTFGSRECIICVQTNRGGEWEQPRDPALSLHNVAGLWCASEPCGVPAVPQGGAGKRCPGAERGTRRRALFSWHRPLGHVLSRRHLLAPGWCQKPVCG